MDLLFVCNVKLPALLVNMKVSAYTSHVPLPCISFHLVMNWGSITQPRFFPLEMRNNLQTCVYAVAEKAADIITADWKEAQGALVKNKKRDMEVDGEAKHNVKRTKRS